VRASSRPAASLPSRRGGPGPGRAFPGRRSGPPADQIMQPADPRHRQDGRSRPGHLGPGQIGIPHRDPRRM